MNGLLCLNSWAGRTETPVEIIDETPKRFRIRASQRTKLAGRDRWLEVGQTALVPKYAVRLTQLAPDTAHAACPKCGRELVCNDSECDFKSSPCR